MRKKTPEKRLPEGNLAAKGSRGLNSLNASEVQSIRGTWAWSES